MKVVDLVTTMSTTELPDVGNISIVAVGIAVGGMVGGIVGRVGRAGRERTTHLTSDGALIGGAVGMVLYATSWVW